MLTSQILIQLIVILLAVQAFGYLCQRIGQPKVIGEILAGLALGPTLLGSLLPRVEATLFPSSVLPALQTLGDIGLILYMFSLGTHIDTHAILKHRRKATVVSLSGIFLPLVLGGAFAFFLYPEFAGSKASLVSFMLLVGTAMAITAFPVLARILEEKRMLATEIGALALLLFLPLYFIYNGLRTHIGLINSPALWLLCALVLVVACLGKVLGGSLSLKVFGAAWKDSLALGTLMNTRGLVELIVLNIGLDLGVISPTFFAMLVIMAVVTTMMASPLLPLLGHPHQHPPDLQVTETVATTYNGSLTNK